MKKKFKFLKWIFIPVFGLLALILVPVGINKLYSSIRASTLTDQERYHEDIDRLEYIMKNEFSGYRVLEGSDAFDIALEELKNKSFDSQTEFNLSVIKAVASFKDPHTFVYNKNVFLDKRFPYYLKWSDGSFYLLSGQVDKKWLGAEVTKIGNASSGEVFKKLSTYTNAPNEAGTAYFIEPALYSADILLEERIIENPKQVALEVELNGEKATLNFNSTSRANFSSLSDYNRISEKYEESELPLFMRNKNQNYWYVHLEEKNILYLRYSMCVDQGNIEPFWEEVFSEIQKIKPDKFIIDVRDNPGGDTQNHSSFVNRLKKNSFINQHGKLYTVIDRGTGSAAVSFASDIEKMTEAILVGEKTMDKPNTTSDPTFFTLPHSGLTILVPSLYSLHSYSVDERDAVYPDMPITQRLKGASYPKDEVMDSLSSFNTDLSHFSYAKLPSNMEGIYNFSAIRNASLSLKDSIWHFSIDGLIEEAPIYQNNSTLFTKKYNINFTDFDSLSKEINITLHGKAMKLGKLETDDISLERSILDRNFKVTESLLNDMTENGGMPFFLGRPYFQKRVYLLYNEYGFEEAIALNQIAKKFYPNDPVISIVDFELYQYEGNTLGQAKAIFPIIGKLIGRYFTVITTDKVMNDDYNAFIGK